MAFTLSDLIQQSYRELGQIEYRTATSGSTSTAADSTLAGTQGGETWKNAGLFVYSTTDGLAPQGEYSLISSYADSTGTFTMAALTVAIGAGDIFGYARNMYSLNQMVVLANDALKELGDIDLIDTSLTTADSQTEYTLPVALKRHGLKRVELQGETGDSNDNQYYPAYGWEVVPAAPGSTGLLVFRDQPSSGYAIKLWYRGVHPTLSVYSSTVSETVPPNLAVAALTEKALMWMNRRTNGSDKFRVQSWNDAKDRLERAKREFPVYLEHEVSDFLKPF